MDLSEDLISQKFTEIDLKLELQATNTEELRVAIDELKETMKEQFQLLFKLLQSSPTKTPAAKTNDFHKKAEEAWARKQLQAEAVRKQQEARKTQQLQQIEKNKSKLEQTLANRRRQEEERKRLAQQLHSQGKLGTSSPPKVAKPPTDQPHSDDSDDSKHVHVIEVHSVDPPKEVHSVDPPKEIHSEHHEQSAPSIPKPAETPSAPVQPPSVFVEKPLETYQEPNPYKQQLEQSLAELTHKFSAEALSKSEPFALSASASSALGLASSLTGEAMLLSDDSKAWFFQILLQLRGKDVPLDRVVSEVNEELQSLLQSGTSLELHFTHVFTTLDFSDTNVDKVEALLENKEEQLNPVLYNQDAGLIAFLLFAVKEACTYAGCLNQAKTPPWRLHARLQHKLAQV